MDESKNKFGKSLRVARAEKGFSQVDCALQCGVSVLTYQFWERGVCFPKDENLKRVCNILDVDWQGD